MYYGLFQKNFDTPYYIAQIHKERVMVLYERTGHLWIKRKNPYEGLNWTTWSINGEWWRKRITKEEIFAELL